MECVLSSLGFNPLKDRVFAVGDLVDRGSESARVIEFLSAPWFHSVCGNHEAMLLDSAAERDLSTDESASTAFWREHGGQWFDDLDRPQQDDIVARCALLPHVIEVELDDGRVAGIVHADSFPDWNKTRDQAEGRRSPRGNRHLLWSGARAKQAMRGDTRAAVDNIDVVYYGHIPMTTPLRCANGLWLDTGAGFRNGRLCVALLGDNHGVWMKGHDDLLLSQGYHDMRSRRSAA